jgi:hypothetical protein
MLPALMVLFCTRFSHLSIDDHLASASAAWCAPLLHMVVKNHSSVWLADARIQELVLRLRDHSHCANVVPQQWQQLDILDDGSTLTTCARQRRPRAQRIVPDVCAVCQERPATHVAEPCCHAHLCDDCYRPGLLATCSYCREPIERHGICAAPSV